ncbi:hypothetical protein ACHAXT_000803 [Thalassiosira profunda]
MASEGTTKTRMHAKHHVDATIHSSCAVNEDLPGTEECLEHTPLLDDTDAFSSLPQTPSAEPALTSEAHATPQNPPTSIPYEHIPTEIQGLIESYLPPSDCAHLSAASASLHRRWTARRWQRTFLMQYGRRNQLRTRERVAHLRRARVRAMEMNVGNGSSRLGHTHISKGDASAAFAKYAEIYEDGWEFTFVGCCHEQQDFCSKCNQGKLIEKDGEVVFRSQADATASHQQYIGRQDSCDDMSALTTQFNVTALVPSVRRAYVDLWDTIELSLLGYYDADETETAAAAHFVRHPTHHSQFPVPAIMRILRTSVLPELAEYLFFMVGFKPLAVRGMDSRGGAAARGRRRRRDSSVMGPMLARGLGGVRLGSDRTTATANDERSSVSQPQKNTANPHIERTATTLDEINSLRDAATTMSAWKLACILRERGVGCLRCAICDRIDLMGDDFVDECNAPAENAVSDEGGYQASNIEPQSRTSSGRSPFLREFQKQVGGGDAWMTPCQCPELVHRQCLERRLKLVPKHERWERMKRSVGRVCGLLCASISGKRHQGNGSSNAPNNEPIAPRVWIAYDRGPVVEEEQSAIAVDSMGRFCSSAARCETCGWQFLRTVRLPRSKWEVLAASLSDPISVMRAWSTFIHFVLVCTFLAACEGMCTDASCDSHRTLLTTKMGVLKWPTTGLNGLALAWWQLQQCCMLHIFFSRRFAAIVDRLWMGPISLFYCRLYFYFLLTSALLAASYIPMVTRSIRINVFERIFSPWVLEHLQPVGNAVAFVNLFQYVVVSTTVICIFWRTHYRIFTVADGKQAVATLRHREELERNARAEGGQRRDAGQNNLAPHNANPAVNAVPMQRIVGVGAGDGNAANHPIYHGPW